MIKRRSQREKCTVCGNRVAIRDDGSLRPHYRGEGGRIRWNNELRCPGGFDPNDNWTIRMAATEQGARYGNPLPSEGELSVRTVSGGLPSSGRKR